MNCLVSPDFTFYLLTLTFLTQQDCSTNPTATCSCETSACTSVTTTTLASSLPPLVVVTPSTSSMSPITMTRTEIWFPAMTSTSLTVRVPPTQTATSTTIKTTPQTTSTQSISVSTTQVDTSTPTNATAGVATVFNDAQLFDDNLALIGGIAGGAAALLLLVGGLIAFFVVRSRRRGKDEPIKPQTPQADHQSAQNNDINMNDVGGSSHRSNCESVPPDSNYGIVPPQNYAAWSSTTEADFAKSSPPNRTDYEDFTKVH
jgi:hypothetical protein